MSRISIPAVSKAIGATAEVYAGIKTFAAIGALQPAALGAVFDVGAALATGSLSNKDLETIELIVSVTAGCGKLAALKPDELKKIRAGEPTGDAKRDALVRFVRTLAATSGTVGDGDFAAIKVAGYTDAQLVDIGLVFATIVFSNVFNRINDTEIDFLAVASSDYLGQRVNQGVRQ